MTAAASWFHCSVKPVSRSAGRSVVAAAAYRLGARLEDHQYGELRDYTRRSGVVTSFTLAPGHAAWAIDAERLWNAAEAAENRRNSQLARECELALPASLPATDRVAIVRTLAQDLVDRYGVAVTAAIHAPSRQGDDRNHHAHILMTTREATPDGLGKKTRILDAKATGPGEVRWMRQHAADLINVALEDAGLDERVDHRSFADRGVTREPTKHLGPTATEMERRGEASDRGLANDTITGGNQRLHELVDELAAVDAEIAAEQERELDGRYGLAAPEAHPAGGGALTRGLRGFFRDATPELFELPVTTSSPSAPAWRRQATFDPASDPATAADQVRDVAAQFSIEELDLGTSKTAGEPSTRTNSQPAFAAPADAATAAEQVRAAARPFAEAIRQWGVVPEIVVNLVEDGLKWWQRATQHLAELAEDVRDTVLTWRDHARTEREERNRDDDALDFD